MYLAAIADSQPQPPTMHSQYPPSGIMQPGGHYMQQQQAQSMTPQAMMAARSSMLYNPQPYAALQQTQPMHGQFSLNFGASNGLTMLQGESNIAGHGGSTLLHDYGRGTSGDTGLLGIGRILGKQDMASSSSSDGRGHDGSENLYLKSADDGN
ncbi:hypothetical protein Droror1_Dr00025272 [Drosera rotundifolia]